MVPPGFCSGSQYSGCNSHYHRECQLFRYMNEQQVTLAEITTSFGEKRQVTLPDGTLLVLNSCSQVRYPDRFVGDLREVELEGEGYFRVARNERCHLL